MIIRRTSAQRNAENTDHAWMHTEFAEWSWVELGAQMDKDTMEYVVCGRDRDRSRGLVCCETCPCPTPYDDCMRKTSVRGKAPTEEKQAR